MLTYLSNPARRRSVVQRNERRRKSVTNVIQVFTRKSVRSILAVGGTHSWALNRSRALGCKYAVCCRNASQPIPEAPEPHGSAFLVGLVSGVVPSPARDGRWLVQFSHYALVDAPDQWEGRNPVRFYETKDYEGEIDFGELNWIPMPETDPNTESEPVRPLTIHEAKLGLSKGYGIPADSIEIVIRG